MKKICHNDPSSRSETCNVDVINSDTFRLVVDIVGELVTPKLVYNRDENCNYESNHQNNKKSDQIQIQSSPDWISQWVARIVTLSPR